MPAFDRLLYVSIVAPDTGEAQVQAILAVSRDRNPGQGVTGALLYTGTHFTQWLEGPREALDALMRSIAADPRHTDVRLLLREPAGARRFAEWAMHYVDSVASADLIEDLHGREAIDSERADRLADHLFGAVRA